MREREKTQRTLQSTTSPARSRPILGKESHSGIPVHELCRGITLCLQNARAFLEEAQILNGKNHLRHSIGLIGLAVEEMGKANHLVDVLEIAAIGNRPFFDWSIFRKHPPKLAYVPKPFLRGESKKDRRLRDHLKRFYRETPILRQRSFYVDLKEGHWLWGNPELEKVNIVAFIIENLRVDCDYIQALLNRAKLLWRKIARYGRDDDRVRDFLKKHFGTEQTINNIS